MKILIAYYSRKGENYWSGSIKNLEKGNTQIIAEYIQEATGGDLFEINTVAPYPADYHKCTEVAKIELRHNARPALSCVLENLNDYDVIFLGYPNWWGTCPMAVLTFLDSCDFDGKKLFPFCTNEGSGMGDSERHIKKECPRASIGKGLAITGHRAIFAREETVDWAIRSMAQSEATKGRILYETTGVHGNGMDQRS